MILIWQIIAPLFTPFVTAHLVTHLIMWLRVGINGRLTLGSLASTACYLVESCRWEMSSACPYQPLSLASAQTKNTFTNIHLPCPACMLTLFILANPYVQCTRTGSDGELKGLYDHWLGKTTGGWVALYTAFFQRPRPAHRAPPLGSACLWESEREKYIDLMPWAFPPACSLAKRLPLFTFRSIRAVNSSENTVIVAVVKRYVQLHAPLLPFRPFLCLSSLFLVFILF